MQNFILTELTKQNKKIVQRNIRTSLIEIKSTIYQYLVH